MTKEEFVFWRTQSDTQEVFSYLKRRRTEWGEALKNLCLHSQKTDDMIQAAKIAAIQDAVDMIIQLDYEDLKEDMVMITKEDGDGRA